MSELRTLGCNYDRISLIWVDGAHEKKSSHEGRVDAEALAVRPGLFAPLRMEAGGEQQHEPRLLRLANLDGSGAGKNRNPHQKRWP